MKNELFCPKCNANLKKQFGFYENINIWVCEECGETLINPNYLDDMIWYCNGCNDIMNNQSGWDPYFHGKYKCKHCGAINDISVPNDYNYEDEEGTIYFRNDPDEIIDDDNLSGDDLKYAKRINKNKEKAEDYLNNRDKLGEFLDDLEKHLNFENSTKGLAYIPVMISMLRSYYDGTYKEPPYKVILAVVSVLIYWIAPVDLIPDFIPGIGYVDDAAVVALALKLIKDDLDTYKEWKKNK